MLHMAFYWSRQVTLLFDSWSTTMWLSYALTLLACLIVPAFYQYLAQLRVRLRLASSAGTSADPIQTPRKLSAGGKFSAVKFAGAVIFAVNSVIGYMLMLAVMSFNGGVFVAIVMGLAVGYLLFRSGEEDVRRDVPKTGWDEMELIPSHIADIENETERDEIELIPSHIADIENGTERDEICVF